MVFFLSNEKLMRKVARHQFVKENCFETLVLTFFLNSIRHKIVGPVIRVGISKPPPFETKDSDYEVVNLLVTHYSSAPIESQGP